MKPQEKPKDALELLTRDYQIVKDLFTIYEGLSDRAVVIKKEIAETICNELIIHAHIEVEVFYPEVRRAIQHGDMMDKAVIRHSAVKELIAHIQCMSSDDYFYDAKLKVLSEKIEYHVKEEEREIFPKVRKSGIDLLALGREMQQRKLELKSSKLVA